jgi:hypothetical protein
MHRVDDVWQQVLTEAGLDVLVTDAEHVRLRAGSGAAATYGMKVLTWVPSPAQLTEPPSGPGLLVVPRATKRLLAAADRLGWSIVTDSGIARIRLPGEHVTFDASASVRAGLTGPRHRVPWGTLTAVRGLLEDAPVRQRELAARAGTSQARVSQVLSGLVGQALVERGPRGWAPTSWEALLDWWLDHYPGHRGASSYWYSLDDLRTQTRTTMRALAAVDGSDPVLSGDMAADLLTPWRHPLRVTIYAHRLTDLSHHGFVPAVAAEEATLVLHAPRDRGVWSDRPWTRDLDGHPTALADVLQILWDLVAVPRPDNAEAATRFRAAVRERRWAEAAGG